MNLQAAGDGIGRVGTGNMNIPRKEECNDCGDEYCHAGDNIVIVMNGGTEASGWVLSSSNRYS
jgi:hypothetical protein